jgi:tetratricopeptide (TPR) repeat protein
MRLVVLAWALTCLFGRTTVRGQSPVEQAREHFDAGTDAYKAHDLDKAEEEFRAALKLRPAYLEARENLAITLARKGKFDLATEEVRKVLAAESSFGGSDCRFGLDPVLARKPRVGIQRIPQGQNP